VLGKVPKTRAELLKVTPQQMMQMYSTILMVFASQSPDHASLIPPMSEKQQHMIELKVHRTNKI
jgi:hypothetical protein